MTHHPLPPEAPREFEGARLLKPGAPAWLAWIGWMLVAIFLSASVWCFARGIAHAIAHVSVPR